MPITSHRLSLFVNISKFNDVASKVKIGIILISDDEKHGGKMMFKKPDKQAKSESEKAKKKSKMKQVKNSTLLSFGDEEEED